MYKPVETLTEYIFSIQQNLNILKCNKLNGRFSGVAWGIKMTINEIVCVGGGGKNPPNYNKWSTLATVFGIILYFIDPLKINDVFKRKYLCQH